VSVNVIERLSQDAEEVCLGEQPGFLCEWILEATGNERLARGVDTFVALPGRILLVILVALIVTAFARRLVRRVTERMREPTVSSRVGKAVGRTVGKGLFADRPQTAARRRQRADAIGGLLRGVILFLVWAVALFVLLEQLAVDVRPLLAGAGILGIALGFGAQNLVRDLLSGVFMLIEDQYGVGDVIDVGHTSGVVEGVGLRVTRLRDVNGVLWHVPNGMIEAVGNMSQEWSRALLDVEVAYGTDVDHAKAVILGVAREMWEDDPEWSEVIVDEPELWGVEALTNTGIMIRLVVQTRPLEQWNVAREMRSRLLAAFAEADITIPVEQRVVWLRTDGNVPGTPEAMQEGLREGRETRERLRSATDEEVEEAEGRRTPSEVRADDAAPDDAETSGARMPPPSHDGPSGGTSDGGTSSGGASHGDGSNRG
jgi:moderate conductance mechanosensitive channel